MLTDKCSSHPTEKQPHFIANRDRYKFPQSVIRQESTLCRVQINGYIYNTTPTPKVQATFQKTGEKIIKARRYGSLL